MTETTETTRDQFEREIERAYDTRDRIGKLLFHLAVHAVARGDRPMAFDLVEIESMPRRGGRKVDLDACEAFGALSQRVDQLELRLWAAAASEAYCAGDPDLLNALDSLARRRVCH